jgi:hypothetical protein
MDTPQTGRRRPRPTLCVARLPLCSAAGQALTLLAPLRLSACCSTRYRPPHRPSLRRRPDSAHLPSKTTTTLTTTSRSSRPSAASRASRSKAAASSASSLQRPRPSDQHRARPQPAGTTGQRPISCRGTHRSSPVTPSSRRQRQAAMILAGWQLRKCRFRPHHLRARPRRSTSSHRPLGQPPRS